MGFNDNQSVQVCRVALKMAISSREEEKLYMEEFKKKNIKTLYVFKSLSTKSEKIRKQLAQLLD